ncbi:glycosyltransferase [Prosthecobacter sp.]|uniref:glycosyltransferase n=1 Tax=Prosthecobacter sp. TaxID=1965333 RepID=UPI002ABAEEC8|nr:glycosyltransferase [Prosthecobacter sp.]MDZ4403463.1 glycosyltransferase [Prosthecobacter sp.]
MPATVHLVIPCYQESGRIGPFLAELCAVTHELGDVTIRVVEDGSDDAEAARMRAIITPLCEKHPYLLDPLFMPDNLGKGGAVYTGWNMEKTADWLGFVDADGSCSAAEVVRLIHLARKQPTPHTALFASRLGQFGRKVHRQWKRRLIGHVFGSLVSTLLHIRIHDSQCGLKLVPRSTYQRIAPALRIHGFAFDVELLAALHDTGCPFHEIPISWFETPGGHVHLVRDSFRMARDVWRVRQGRSHRAG